jgi:L-alanine-DL-glutamate epimerase-like enolase superfamily enzyme
MNGSGRIVKRAHTTELPGANLFSAFLTNAFVGRLRRLRHGWQISPRVVEPRLLEIMKIKSFQFELHLAHEWATAASGAKKGRIVTFVELTSPDGVTGIGESAPSNRYGETLETVIAFLKQVNPQRLSFDDVTASMAYLDEVSANDFAAKAAVNIALVDGAAKKAGKAVYDFLGLGFTENKHVTSYTIGIDTPEKVRQKVLEAAQYPMLKLKVGVPQEREIMEALRGVAPLKKLCIDANEGWQTKEAALKNIEWFARDPHIEFVEQPMPAGTSAQDLAWLKQRSPLPVFADESFISAKDAAFCAECYHGVNVKLVKTGGISGGYAALQAARKAGLKTMIGCMIESSVLITAGAHLAGLADYLDIDTNLLITNDPYRGCSARNGIISFAEAPEKTGLRVRANSRPA